MYLSQRQIRWGVANVSITKNGVLPVTNLFFCKYWFKLRTLIKSWFDVPTTQMFISITFVSAGALFEGAFSLWVSLYRYGKSLNERKALKCLGCC